MVPDAGVGAGGHASLVEYAAWGCVLGSLRGLMSDRSEFPDLRALVVGHAVGEERAVLGVGCLHLVPYGPSTLGPCRTDGLGGCGGGLAPLCRPCFGDGAFARLQGGGGVC